MVRSRTLALVLLLVGLVAGSAQLQAGNAPKAQKLANGAGTTKLPPARIGHIGHLDFRNGFRHWCFGTAVSEIPNLTLDQDLGRIKLYVKSDEELQVGEARLQRVVYHFLNGKLMGVSLFAKGGHDSRAIREVMEAAFGPGARPHRTRNEYWWSGHVVNARYSEEASSDDAQIWIGNIAMESEAASVQKDALERAAQSL